MFKPLYLLVFLTPYCYGVIYNLNETEYRRMPPIYHIDDYENCFASPNSLYCSVNFDLVSDEPSNLLYIIQEYSKHLVTHYNHTKLRYGVCVTNNCQRIQNKSEVSEYYLEGCLNETMWKNYKLKSKVRNYICYDNSDNNVQIDAADIVVFIILLLLFTLNIIGSIYDAYWNKSGDRSLLLCFSLKRNWKRLTSSTQNTESRLQKFVGINGIRCIILYGVIIVHSFWAYMVAIKNAQDLEKMFLSLPLHLFFDGSTAIQTNLVISGLLLAYKMEIYTEKRQMNWRLIPRGILLRYLRLTPAYAVVIALMATWLKFLGPSALWEVTAKPALVDCQSRWWLNLLYLNNYVYNSQCMLHGWYVAVDMQLFCLGMVLCVLLKKSKSRRIVLTALFVIGVLIPGIITYLKNLDGLLIIRPGESRYLFETDVTFNEVYKVGHTNIASFIIGMGLGYMVYRLPQKKTDIETYKKFRILHWASLPLLIAIIITGSVFYRDAPEEPLYIRVLYATLVKPLFGFVMAFFICGLILRIENIYSTFFESKIWTIPSKLSYCVFVIHFSYLRIHVAMHSHLLYITNYNMILMATCITAISLITAVPLWLFVEAPFTELTKYMTSNNPQKKREIRNYEYCEKVDNNLN